MKYFYFLLLYSYCTLQLWSRQWSKSSSSSSTLALVYLRMIQTVHFFLSPSPYLVKCGRGRNER